MVTTIITMILSMKQVIMEIICSSDVMKRALSAKSRDVLSRTCAMVTKFHFSVCHVLSLKSTI